MANSYYAYKLSENISETPEGYLIFRNAVIARTGKQTYKGAELPQRGFNTPKEEVTAQDIGIEPDDNVDLYRSSAEVFRPATIASFESKPITDGHPSNLLDSETHVEHACGHIRNVRKGKEPLADGNWPLLADGQVTDKNLVLKIKAGLRELSCGYTYQLLKQYGQILMVDIVGNHVAVVPTGRAGPLAAIQDAAPAAMDAVSRLTVAEMALLETLFESQSHRPAARRTTANDTQLRDIYGQPVSHELAANEPAMLAEPLKYQPYKYDGN